MSDHLYSYSLSALCPLPPTAPEYFYYSGHDSVHILPRIGNNHIRLEVYLLPYQYPTSEMNWHLIPSFHVPWIEFHKIIVGEETNPIKQSQKLSIE